jgi:hypothetical protein
LKLLFPKEVHAEPQRTRRYGRGKNLTLITALEAVIHDFCHIFQKFLDKNVIK